MSIKEYEEQLLLSDESRSESVMQKLADKFEDDLLEYDEFPEEYFDLIIKMLSDERLYSKSGAWNFLLVLGTERDKLSKNHYRTLEKYILENYENYFDEDLCLAVCDFVARNYAFVEAKKIFDLLWLIENKKPAGLQGFVEDGRRIMIAEEQRRKQ